MRMLSCRSNSLAASSASCIDRATEPFDRLSEQPVAGPDSHALPRDRPGRACGESHEIAKRTVTVFRSSQATGRWMRGVAHANRTRFVGVFLVARAEDVHGGQSRHQVLRDATGVPRATSRSLPSSHLQRSHPIPAATRWLTKRQITGLQGLRVEPIAV